jgi:hypothetical protein
MNKTTTEKQSFETCPRCNGTWEDFEQGHNLKNLMQKCNKCSLRNNFTTNQTLVLPDIIKAGDRLGWLYKHSACLYGTLDEIVGNKGIKLPILPFDITKEALEQLLIENKDNFFIDP